MNNLSLPTKIAIGLLYLFIAINIVLVSLSLGEPSEGGEFAALHNFAMLVYAVFIGGGSLVLFISSFFLWKQKRWAYFLSFILILLILPILAFSDLKEIAFNLTPGAEISLNKEVLPIAILFLLLIGRKDFRKVQTSK